MRTNPGPGKPRAALRIQNAQWHPALPENNSARAGCCGLGPAGLSGPDISTHSQGMPRERPRQSRRHTLQRDTRPAPDKDSRGKSAGGTRAHHGEEATKTHHLSGRSSTLAKGLHFSAATREASKGAPERSGAVPKKCEIIRRNGANRNAYIYAISPPPSKSAIGVER